MQPKTKNRVCIGLGVCALLTAVFMVIVGVFITDLVDDAINDAIEDGITLTKSDESNNRESWVDFVNTDVTFDYYVFNYTNVDDWLDNGVKPTLEETGPYSWIEFSQKYNISFSEDGEMISYNVWWYKEPLAGNTGLTADGNTLNIMNPVYWGLNSIVFDLLKRSLHANFKSATADATTAAFAESLYGNLDQNFPFGLLGPLVIPADQLGDSVPPADVVVPNTDKLVGKFAGSLVLGQLYSILALPSGDARNLLPFVGGFFRQMVNDGYNNSQGGAYMPPYGYAEDDGLAKTVAYVLNVGELYLGVDGEIPEGRACNGTVAEFADAVKCPLGAAAAAAVEDAGGTADFTSVVSYLAGTIFAPNVTASLISAESSVWEAAVAGDPTSIGTVQALFGANLSTAAIAYVQANVVENMTEYMSAAKSVRATYEARAVSGLKLLVIDGGVTSNAGYDAAIADLLGGDPTAITAIVGATELAVRYLYQNSAGDAEASTFVEVGYAQFARGAATGGTSLVAGEAGARGGDFYFGFEYGVWQRAMDTTGGEAGFTSYDLAFDTAELWLNPTRPDTIANSTLYGALLLDSLIGAEGAFFSGSAAPLVYYGITGSPHFLQVLEYLQVYLPFHELVYRLMVSENFGPFFTVTPEELLLGNAAPAALDAALAPLGSSADNPGLISSYDSQEDHFEETKQGLYTLYTGVGGKLQLARQYVAYRGVQTLTTLRDASFDQEKQAANFSETSTCIYSETVNVNQSCIAWREPEVITDSSAATFFGPFNEDADVESFVYRVWIVEGMRVIDAVWETEETVKGIKVNRYVAAAKTVQRAVDESSPNYKYRMDTTPTGIVPMQLFARGLPAVVSRPHFWEGDVENLINKVDGLNPTEEQHTTFVDIEPLTGATMRAAKRFQNNVYMEPVRNDWPYFANAWDYITDEDSKYIYLPWYWGTERGIIDDDDASDFRSGVYDNRDLADTLSIVFLVVGIAMAAASTICLIYYCRKKGEEGSTMPARLESKTNL